MKKWSAIILIVVLLAGVAIGWLLRNGRDDKPAMSPATPPASKTQGIGNKTAGSQLKNLTAYSLPDGWQEATCDNHQDTVYILPPQVSLDCNADPSAPISLSLSGQNMPDCQQLDGQSNVRTHTCKSAEVNGKKSLQASTEYNQAAVRPAGSTVDLYYVDIGKSVVRAEYHYDGDGSYQPGFRELVDSLAAK